MSEQWTPIGPEHLCYLAQRARPEPALLGELKRAAAEQGIARIWIAPEQAALMRILLRLCAAREVLEIGTLAGYSALSMALALPPGGRVLTLEKNPMHADFARHWCARAQLELRLAARVEVREGAAADSLATLASGSFDAVFLDADKGGYAHYLEQAARLLRPGGLLLVDNAFAFGELFAAEPRDSETLAVRAFNELLAADDRFEALIVPIGDGLWVGLRC